MWLPFSNVKDFTYLFPGILRITEVNIAYTLTDKLSFFRLHVRLNFFFLSCKMCLSWELFGSWEICSPRDFRFSFSVSHSRSNQLFCDMALVLLRWTLKPAFLHASTRVSLNNSAAVSTLSFLKAACSLDWTICDSRHSFSLFFNLVSHNSLLCSDKVHPFEQLN